MPNVKETIVKIGWGEYAKSINDVYPDNYDGHAARLAAAAECFGREFGGEREITLFSASGRSEISGNHTDHQNGCAVAMAVDADVIAVVSLNDENAVRIKSEGFPLVEVSLENLDVIENEKFTSNALVRGIASYFSQNGYHIGGFDAYTTSTIPTGSGMSSSAAFEVLVAKILSCLFNSDTVSPKELAICGRFAENNYFGKSCGLLDQLTIAYGGLLFMDFGDVCDVKAENIDYDFNTSGYELCIVNTGKGHGDLSDDYSTITSEMCSVAQHFGCDTLKGIKKEQILENINVLRDKCGDRAVIRSLNFIDENKRANDVKNALDAGDFSAFKRLILASGNGSYKYLQNVISPTRPSEQSLALALYLCEQQLKGRGAWRVHGGGFAGTIQAFLPLDMHNEFKALMESVFGEGACIFAKGRNIGAVQFTVSK